MRGGAAADAIEIPVLSCNILRQINFKLYFFTAAPGNVPESVKTTLECCVRRCCTPGVSIGLLAPGREARNVVTVRDMIRQEPTAFRRLS